MAAHQCPRCPLRFSFRAELEFHLREDHDRGLRAQVTEPADEPAIWHHLTDQNGGRPNELVAASATALLVSPRSGVSPADIDRSLSPRSDAERTLGPPQRTAPVAGHGVDRPLPAVTLMPRWVVVTVIALVVLVLGFGLLFGT